MEVLYFLQLPLNYFSYMFKTTKFRPVAVFMKGKYRTRQPIRQLMLK